jgi:hypothetical protein
MGLHFRTNQDDRIHNDFHVSYVGPWSRSHHDKTLPMLELEDNQEREVEELTVVHVIQHFILFA